MNDTEGTDPCPHCGTPLIFQNALPALQLRTVLNKKYLIGKCFGKGEIEFTYLGYDLSLKSRVAIKEYLPKLIATRSVDKTVQPNSKDDEDVYEYGLGRFLKQAQMLGKFNHPSIITVYSCFKENNTAYFVMPFIPGNTLEQYVIERDGISEEELFRIMTPILEGLKEAHNAHILHKDINPSNIFIPNESKPLLLNFGLRDIYINIMGKCNITISIVNGYWALELFMNTGIGPSADIYACAATMYSCIRGKIGKNIKTGKPYIIPPTSVMDIYNERISHPHIKEVTSQPISDKFANAIMEGLELRPEQRPHTISEFQKKLGIKNIGLLVLAGEFEGERIPLTSKPITIGRDPKKCSLILSDNKIAPIHCQIHAINDVIYVKDLSSKGGTWINDMKRLYPLKTTNIELGDTISLAGCAVFKIVEAESPEPPLCTDSFWTKIGKAIKKYKTGNIRSCL